ncbi:DUF998 domain-containing protein [Halobiforma nitratireducens]|uniref:DUF998 domain-containing protein n=1 Tax=Halobiforma nitratireducens JCM 10879 TaxID=1227454 RepID=M0L0X3_9EURY|nr:hypothetical protein [Halobiforma nitratireducens]EMA27196.1 hypothetical protein C446_18166 [Halobiforma nitratireducens JCM 10879]
MESQIRNPFRWPLTVLGGILVLLGEAFFTGQAYRRWPGEFSPLTHYHSDLGMTVGGPPGTNTALGAQYYNAGQVFIGLAVILFIGGLYVYYRGDRRPDALLIFGQFAGIFIGVALIMNGVYSLDFEGHGMWVVPMFLGITVGLIPINAALYGYPGFPRWIAGYGVIVALLPLGRYLLMYVTADPLFIAEWILIYGAFVWIFLVTIDAFKRGVLSNRFQ